jgi:hypothetical protein
MSWDVGELPIDLEGPLPGCIGQLGGHDVDPGGVARVVPVALVQPVASKHTTVRTVAAMRRSRIRAHSHVRVLVVHVLCM